MSALADFMVEFCQQPKIRAAVEQDAAWAQRLADLRDIMCALEVHAGAREIAVCDELVRIVTRKDVPVGKRMIAVRDAFARAHYAVHPQPN